MATHRDDLGLVARCLWLDGMAADAVRCLKAAGIPSILLKGAAIATWLYDDGAVRPYKDIDLLVPPADFERAVTALGGAGYSHWLSGASPFEFGPNELELVGPGGAVIDLHHRLIGVPDPPERCWDVLSRHLVPFLLAGEEVQVLHPHARILHLALHAAQNGPVDRKAVADLQRGLERAAHEHWRAAAELAEELEAVPAFSAGLRLVPAGAAVAEELRLPRDMSVELALRTSSAPQDAFVFDRLSQPGGVRPKMALIGRKLFPTATFLRSQSPLARRGRLGLLLARILRIASLLARLGPAFVAWKRAHRQACGGR